MKQTVFYSLVKFYDEYTSTGGGGANYPNFRVLDKARAELSFYFKWGTYDTTLVFVSATKVISRETGSFVDEGIKAGDTLTPIGTASNAGNKTVVSVTDLEMVVAEVLVDEIVSCSLHGVTSVTSIDYLYNLLSSNSSADFFSLVDSSSKPTYYKTGLLCTNVAPVAMVANGRSQAWNNTETITIQGGGDIVDYKQSFKIIHYFRVAPFWLAGQDSLFNNITPPQYSPLKFIAQVQTAFAVGNPTPDHFQAYDVAGRIGWFNESERGVSNYTAESIVCDSDDFDLDIVTNWTAVLKSAGLFTMSTKVQLSFFRCPSSEEAYVYRSTSLLKNFMLDTCFVGMDVCGITSNFGTDYQVFDGVCPDYIDANTISITFGIDMATFLKDIFKAADPSDRKFVIAISTQNQAIATTVETDRACMLFAFENFGWNQNDATGITLVDYLRCFQYPNRATEPKNNFVMYPNEPGYCDIPFRVKLNETLISSTVQIVAYKEGQDDFVLEEKVFNTENIRSLLGAQTINIREERGYQTYQNDFYNQMYLIRRPAWDSETHFGLLFHYSFLARYEEWLTAISLGDAQGIDVARSIENLTQFWHNFTAQGWGLKLLWKASKKDADGIQTDYQASTTITMKNLGDVSHPPGCVCTTRYYDEDNVEIDAIEADTKTKIVATFTGDFATVLENFTDPTAFFRTDLRDIGNGLSSRFASPEWNGEDDSPFSSEGIDADPAALDSYASNTSRVDIFADKLVLSAFYDDSVDEWSRKAGSALVYPCLKFKGDTTDCAITYETTLIPILDETNLAILAEDCP